MRTLRAGADRLRPLLIAVLLLAAGAARAEVDLQIAVRDPAAFRDYFWFNQGYGNQLSDYISLSEGEYTIEVFGPPGPPDQPLSGMFYSYSVSVVIGNGTAKVGTTSFNSYCAGAGTRLIVSSWPAPKIEPDGRFPGALRLVIERPALTRREKPCQSPPPPNMASWGNAGVMELAVVSEPPGADVMVNGRFAAKAGRAIKVPYTHGDSTITVIVRSQGLIGCRYDLHSPFESKAALHCKLRTPGAR